MKSRSSFLFINFKSKILKTPQTTFYFVIALIFSNFNSCAEYLFGVDCMLHYKLQMQGFKRKLLCIILIIYRTYVTHYSNLEVQRQRQGELVGQTFFYTPVAFKSPPAFRVQPCITLSLDPEWCERERVLMVEARSARLQYIVVEVAWSKNFSFVLLIAAASTLIFIVLFQTYLTCKHFLLFLTHLFFNCSKHISSIPFMVISL